MMGNGISRGIAALAAGALAVLAIATNCATADAACKHRFPFNWNPGSVTLQFGSSGEVLAALCDRRLKRTAVVRLNRRGHQDEGFAGDGVLGPLPSRWSPDLALDPDRRILLSMRQGEHGEFLLKRFLPNGRVDRSFGSGTGSTLIPSHPGYSWPDSIQVFAQPDGRILVAYHAQQSKCRGAGEVCNYAAEYLKVHRYSPAGHLLYKRTFYAEYWELGAAVMAEDGGLVVVGNYAEAGTTLLRTKPDLSPNPRFGRFGSVFLEQPQAEQGGAYLPSTAALALGPGGSIVIAPEEAGSLRRYKVDGSVDPTFGNQGRTECPDLEDNGMTGFAEAFRFVRGVPSSAAILAAGGTGKCGLVRYQGDGSPDPAFGSGGFVDLEELSLPRPESLAIGAKGQIAVSGWDPKLRAFVVTRLSPQGVVDRRFGAEGSVVLRGFRAVKRQSLLGKQQDRSAARPQAH